MAATDGAAVVVHLVRSSLRYTSKRDWAQVCRELREIYTAPTIAAGRDSLRRVRRHVGRALPGDDRHVAKGVDEFVPFLEFPVELRTVVYTTDEIVNPWAAGRWGCQWATVTS